MKDTFIIKTKYKGIINKLSDKQAGALLKMIFEYVESGANAGSNDDKIDMAFDFIRIDLDAFSNSYQKKIEINRVNGSRGGRPKSQFENPNKPVGYYETERLKNNPNELDNDNETDNVNDNDLFKKEIEFQNFGKVVKTNEDFIEKALSDEEDEFRNLCKKAGLVGNFETVIKDFYQKQKVLGKNWSNFSEFKRHFHNSVPYLKSNKPINNAEITEEKVRSLGYKSVEQFRKVNSG